MARVPGLKHALASAVLALVAATSVAGIAAAGQVQITETGSSLLYPLFNEWVPVYMKTNPNVAITTQSTGSGTGISDAINGTVDMGASDAYVSAVLSNNNPNLVDIPVAISAQQVMYNVPGLNNKHINLTAPVLAEMYEGKITNWDSSAIAKLNSGMKLPNLPIVTIHRADGSGDTFLFSQFLSFAVPSWSKGPSYGTTISWPSVPGSVSATGNSGMVQELQTSKGGVAYIGISWLTKARQEGLGEAALQNRDGKFVLPNHTTIQAAVKAQVKKVPKSERMSLIYGPGAYSYPIVNFEYVIVSKNLPSTIGTTVRKFLTWAVNPSEGNATSLLTPVHFLQLPANVLPLSQKQINEIK